MRQRWRTQSHNCLKLLSNHQNSKVAVIINLEGKLNINSFLIFQNFWTTLKKYSKCTIGYQNQLFCNIGLQILQSEPFKHTEHFSLSFSPCSIWPDYYYHNPHSNYTWFLKRNSLASHNRFSVCCIFFLFERRRDFI